jgi:phosphatidylserine/phosphatidylglycerophosphate/cardiolipin synthase-like enzyme
MNPARIPERPKLLHSGIRDNHKRGAVGEFLVEQIRAGAWLSVVSAYFTIYAYEQLRDQLDAIEHMNFLFGEPRFINALDPNRSEKKSFVIDGDGLHLANVLEQRRVARACAEWIRDRVTIRSLRQANLLHGKMVHIANQGVDSAILGSANFTTRGLGLAGQNNNLELNLVVDSSRDRADLKAWFDELWNDERLVADVTDEVLHYLAQRLRQLRPGVHLLQDALPHLRALSRREQARRVRPRPQHAFRQRNLARAFRFPKRRRQGRHQQDS